MVLTGRGGFGNYVKANIPETVPISPAPIQHVKSPTYKFRTGRGGFGNTIEASELEPITPNQYLDEMHRQSEIEPRKYMIGRGGLGNFVNRSGMSAAATRSDLSSTFSSGSEGSDDLVSPVTSSPLDMFRPVRSKMWDRMVRPSKTR